MQEFDNITTIYGLKASSKNAAVSEKMLSQVQMDLYIKTKLDEYLIDYCLEAYTENKTKLIVLSGNAGDGKSMTLYKLKETLTNDYNLSTDSIVVNADATQTEKPNENLIISLINFFADFMQNHVSNANSIHIIAMNVGIAIKFFGSKEFEALVNKDARFQIIKKVILNELNIEYMDEELRFANSKFIRDILIINFDLRCLVKHNLNCSDSYSSQEVSFFNQMVSKLYSLIDMQKCKKCEVDKCPIYFNLKALQNKIVINKIENILFKVFLFNKVHLTPRNLWDFLYFIVTGGETKYIEYLKINQVDGGLCESFKNINIEEYNKFLFYNNLFDNNCENFILRFIREYREDFDPIFINHKELEIIKILIMSNPEHLIQFTQEKYGKNNFSIDYNLNYKVLENIYRSATSSEGNYDLALLINTICRHFYFFYQDNNGIQLPEILTSNKCQILNNEYFQRFYQCLEVQRGLIVNSEKYEYDEEMLVMIRDELLNTFGRFVAGQSLIQIDTVSTRGKGKLLGVVDVEPDFYANSRYDYINKDLLNVIDYFPNYFNVKINNKSNLKMNLEIYQLMVMSSNGYSITSLDLDRFNQLELISKKLIPKLGNESQIFYEIDKDIFRMKKDLKSIKFEKSE